MSGAAGDDQWDPLLLGLAQQVTARQGQGIDPLLDTFFGFLRRKTDFFHGASNDIVKSAVSKSLEKQFTLAEKEKQIKIDKEKEKQKQAAATAAAQKKAAETDGPVIEELDDEVEDMKENAVVNLNSDGKTVTEVSKTSAKPDAEEDESEEDKGKLKPNSGNGGDLEKYYWTQTLDEVVVNVYIPANIKSKDVRVDFTKTTISVGLKNADPILKGELYDAIKVDDATWTLEDSNYRSKKEKCISIYVQKVKGMTWWSSIVKGDPEINTKKVEPENSKLSDLDGETRQTVEKMMFDQQQKARGLPTSEEQEKRNMLKKFMDSHPEMDFSKAKFS